MTASRPGGPPAAGQTDAPIAGAAAGTIGVRIDARGLRCPWPVLRVARAMREATHVTIIADDPAAAGELASLAAAHGWTFGRSADEFHFGRAACKHSFTDAA